MPEYKFYTDEDGKRRVGLADEAEVCDFCLTPCPPWVYPAAPMEITAHPFITQSDTDWGACEECHRLIKASNIERLVARCVRVQQENDPGKPGEYPPDEECAAILRRQFLRFMDARNGPPRYEPIEQVRDQDNGGEVRRQVGRDPEPGQEGND